MLSFLQLGEGNVGTMSERRGMAKESRKRRIARYRNEATSPLVIEDNSDERKSKRGEEGDECVTYPCEEAEVDYYLHPTGERKLRGWWQNIRGGEWMFHLFSWQCVLINFHGGSFFQSLLFQFTILVRSYRFNIFVRVIIIPRIDNTFVSMKHMRAFYFATCKFDIIGYRRMIRLSLWRTIRYLRKRTLLDLVFNSIQL